MLSRFRPKRNSRKQLTFEKRPIFPGALFIFYTTCDMLVFMDREIILERQKEAENSYNTLKQELEEVNTTYQTRITEINTELVKLEGEYRGYERLLEKLPTKKSKVSPKANVIDATVAEE